MQSLKSVLVLAIIAIGATNSYSFNKMITTKNTFTSSKKRTQCVFKTASNSKNFTIESENESDIFIQEGEINIID